MESKAALKVVLDHDDGVVRAQSWLKGSITLTVHDHPLLREQTKTLTLHVLGKEMTTLTRLLGSSHSTVEHVVFDETIVVHDYRKEQIFEPIEPCTFSYPFSLYLPANMPPSMHFEDSNKHGSCKVQYSLAARLLGEGDQVVATTESSRLTIVGKPLSMKQYPCIVGPTCFPLKAGPLGMIDHGCLVLAAKIDNRHVAKGRKVTLAVTVRNKSQEPIERGLDIQIIEEIVWKVGSHECKETAKLDSWCDVDIPGIKPYMMVDSESQHHQHHQGDAVDSGLTAEMLEDLQSKQNEFKVQIPLRAFDTYRGKLLQITHYLKIFATTKQHKNYHPPPTSASHTPSICLPLEIFDPTIMDSTMAHHQHPPPEKVAQVFADCWPSDVKANTPVNHRPASHRKIHSDTDFTYKDVIPEDEADHPGG